MKHLRTILIWAVVAVAAYLVIRTIEAMDFLGGNVP